MPAVARAVVKERAARLRVAGATALAMELRARVGSESDVLVESSGRGRTAFYAEIGFADCAATGSVRRMRLVDSDAKSLVGVPVE